VASHCLHRDPDSFASIPSRINNPTGRLVDHLCDLPKDFVASVIEFRERLRRDISATRRNLKFLG
jgi:hypothetical protein